MELSKNSETNKKPLNLGRLFFNSLRLWRNGQSWNKSKTFRFYVR